MAATKGTILNLLFDGSSWAPAPLFPFSSCLRTHESGISRHDQDTDISGHFRFFAYGYRNGSPLCAGHRCFYVSYEIPLAHDRGQADRGIFPVV
jgi:hypothetical protein